MDKDEMPLHTMTIEHPSKSRKLNGVGNTFLDLLDLSKYPLITIIHFLIDDVEASQSFQTNGFKKFGVLDCLTLKLILNIQLTICSNPFKTSLSNMMNTSMIG